MRTSLNDQVCTLCTLMFGHFCGAMIAARMGGSVIAATRRERQLAG